MNRTTSLLTLIAMLMLLPATARAYEFAIDGIYYNVNDRGAIVTNNGAANCYSGDVVIPEVVALGDTTYQVVAIGDYAFKNCSDLTSVSIPSTVTSIGQYAFNWCTGLTAMTIPDSVKTIGNGAFYYCTGLQTVKLPDGITTLNEHLFHGCASLTELTIPDGVTSIGGGALKECASLTSVTLPPGITTIDVSVFEACTGLSSMILPDQVTSIKSSAFMDCTGLTEITLNAALKTIGLMAFYNCNSLTEVTLPDSVTTIGEAAFAECKNLSKIHLPAQLTNIAGKGFFDCTSLADVEFPNSLQKIGAQAFGWCRSLKLITFGHSISRIGQEAFSGCASGALITVYNATPCEIYFNPFPSGSVITVPDSASYASTPIWGNYEIHGMFEERTRVTMADFWFKPLNDDVLVKGDVLQADGTVETFVAQGDSLTVKRLMPEQDNTVFITVIDSEGIERIVKYVIKPILNFGKCFSLGTTSTSLIPTFWVSYDEGLELDSCGVTFNGVKHPGQVMAINGDSCLIMTEIVTDLNPSSMYRCCPYLYHRGQMYGHNHDVWLWTNSASDVNSDGEVNILDAATVIIIIHGGGTGGHNHAPGVDDGDDVLIGDVNGDGEVNITDVEAIIREILGK